MAGTELLVAFLVGQQLDKAQKVSKECQCQSGRGAGLMLLLRGVLSEREVVHSLICGSALDFAESIEIFDVRSCALQITCAAEGSHSKKQSRVCVNLPAHSSTAQSQMAL